MSTISASGQDVPLLLQPNDADVLISSHTAPSIGVYQPLTKSNLCRLERSTAPSDEIPNERRGMEASPLTEESSNSASLPDELSLYEMSSAMKFNNYLINDRQALQNHPEIKEEAMKVIDGERESEMGDDAQKELIATTDGYMRSDMGAFLDALWWKLLKDTRMVPKCEVRGEGLQDKQWMPRSWDEDFLKYNRNERFRTPCLPVLKTESRILRDLIDNILPPILTPKPNLVYGMSRFAFTEEEQALNDLYPMFTNLSRGAYHPFLVVEYRDHSGGLDDMRNKASIAAAVLIHGLRSLDDLRPCKCTKKGADIRTWLFSLNLQPIQGELFVDWAYLKDDGAAVYHMNKLAAYWLDVGSDLARMKKHADNVMDWGIGERKEKIQELLAEIRKAKASDGVSGHGGLGKRKEQIKRKWAAVSEEGDELSGA